MPGGLRTPTPQRIRRVIGGTLFRIALEELGDAEQWDRIASLNNLTDPWLSGPIDLQIPPRLRTLTGSAIGNQ